MKKLYIPPIIVGVAAMAFVFRTHLQRSIVEAIQVIQGKKTVSERLVEYGQTVRERLVPYFEGAEVSYPPERIVFVGLKQENVLEVWACGRDKQLRFIRTYPILAASGRLGPKLEEGDGQVPEGIYRIESLNPNSAFHLSLRINYPNESDLAQARRDERTNPGGDIMIHGSRASIGCLAMGNEAAEDLFILAAETGIDNISVILSPVDFRKTEMPELTYPLPRWTDALYEQIRKELMKLTDGRLRPSKSGI